MTTGQPQNPSTGPGGPSEMDSGAWDARYAAAELVWGAEPNRWVVEEVADLPPGRALDLAAGEGRNALWLATGGWEVTAVDFSKVALERGQALAAALPDGAAAHLTWVQADVDRYEPKPGAFDLVVIAYLHLPAGRRRAVLRNAAAALTPGGTLLVVAHDSTNPAEGIGGPQDPGILFSPDDVVADLAGTGLEVVRAERVRRPVAVPGGDGVKDAIDALARLRRPGSS